MRPPTTRSICLPGLPSEAAAGAAACALLLASAVWLSGCVTKSMVGNDRSVAGTVHVCSSCHGFGGRSQNPDFPNLAGQQKAYLIAQLKAFRDHKRADPHGRTYMWGMAAKLSDPMIEGVATYFSQQTPQAPEPADPVLAAAGKKIVADGIPAENVPACSACHGAQGEGADEVPRLSGQHAHYLVDQLTAFRANSRANETMHENVQQMTDQQMREVAAYLASL